MRDRKDKTNIFNAFNISAMQSINSTVLLEREEPTHRQICWVQQRYPLRAGLFSLAVVILDISIHDTNKGSVSHAREERRSTLMIHSKPIANVWDGIYP